MSKLSYALFPLLLAALLLTACAPAVSLGGGLGAPTGQPAVHSAPYLAQVDSLQVQVTEGSPQQVLALVRGTFSESCATLGDTQVQYSANTFRISVYAVSPVDRGCAPASSPFQTSVPLDLTGLAPGDYTVTANGITAAFTLKVAEPASTATPTPAAPPAPAGHPCTDAAAYITDVTSPDNVLFAPRTNFTKTWRLKNTGTCVWTSDYRVHHISGDDFTQQPGYPFLQPGQRVAPGGTADVSVDMQAPMLTGYFTAYWGIQAPDGRLIPISGGAGGNSFFVKIRVSDPVIGGAGKIVDQSIEIVLEQGSGEACTPGATYLVHARVSADGPLSALYEIDSTAGQISAGYFISPRSGGPVSTVEDVVAFDASLFAADGVQTITIPLRFVGPYPYPDNIKVNFWVDGGQWVSAQLPCP